jgi:mannose/fructose/N-acetylgalactosamine-specific phosphotransferase system component IID
MWWIWIFFNLSSFSMERMQSMAFIYMMAPILRKYYGNDPEGMKDALKRHMVFFNTEPQTGVIAHGVATALEEQKANGSPIEDDAINAVKAGIMGPMAGIGDAMIPGTLIPILLGIGIGLSGTEGSPIGPIFYAVSYLIIILLLSYWLFTFGYRYGMETMAQLAAGAFRRVTTSMAVLGLIVAGGIGASIVSLKTPLAYTSGQLSVSVQKSLDGVLPQLIPFLLVIWLWNGMRNRGWSINKALGMLFLVIFIGYLPAIIAFLIPSLNFLKYFSIW